MIYPRENDKFTLLFHVLILRLSLFQSLFSTTALGLGGKYFLYYELERVCCQWDNIMISPRESVASGIIS